MKGLVVNGMAGLTRSLLDMVVPEACQLCGDPKPGGPLCKGCRADLPWIGCACPGCARPLPEPGYCGACLRRPPPWQAAVAPLAWAFPVDRLVARLKYGGALHHARLLGGLLAEVVGGRSVDILVPVPLHPARLGERGYNQALEIARPVARRIGAALRPAACRRIRATPPQAGLAGSARRRNVARAFGMTQTLHGLRAAIVDDVLTTGATVREVTRALRRAGAVHIEVWAVARAGIRGAAPQAVRNV